MYADIKSKACNLAQQIPDGSGHTFCGGHMNFDTTPYAISNQIGQNSSCISTTTYYFSIQQQWQHSIIEVNILKIIYNSAMLIVRPAIRPLKRK
jgi:hypothetical protein